MSLYRTFLSAFLSLLACAWLPARLSALTVATNSGRAVKPVRLNIVSGPSPIASFRVSYFPIIKQQPVLVGPPLLAARFPPQAEAISKKGTNAPLVQFDRIAGKPKPPSNDPEKWEDLMDFGYFPLVRIQTGYASMGPRRKIGFLREGESEIFEPSPWGPRRKVGFLRDGESEFFESSP